MPFDNFLNYMFNGFFLKGGGGERTGNIYLIWDFGDNVIYGWTVGDMDINRLSDSYPVLNKKSIGRCFGCII